MLIPSTTQLKRKETQMEKLEIKPGDIVRLLQPFRAERYSFREYAFGIVAGVVRNGLTSSEISQLLWNCQQTTQRHQLGADELVIYLYDPDSSTIYLDQFGVSALFSFDSDEVELSKAI